jgi:lipid-binding SYLF domain-containing protein
MRNAIGLFAIASACMLGCAHAPTQPGARADLIHESQQVLAKMEAKDPSMKGLIDNSVGYIVFPRAGEGGLLVGGGSGAGVLFQKDGTVSHFAELRTVKAGALAGAQRYSEIIIIKDDQTLQDLKTGRYQFGADANAVVARSGAAASSTWDNGTAVFTLPEKGAMVNASIGGQRIRLTL